MDYTPEQQVAYETMIADRYEVDPTYFAEKYSMPVGKLPPGDTRLPPAPDDNDDEGNDPTGGDGDGNKPKGKQKNAHRFFD